MIKILFFAQLVEIAQTDSIKLEYTSGMTSRDAVTKLESSMPKELISALRFDAVMLSINQTFASWDDPLQDGDEIAFLPPFSGG